MRQRGPSLEHPEDSLSAFFAGVQWEDKARKKFYTIPGGRGRGMLHLPDQDYQQHVIVKVRVYTTRKTTGTWYTHGAYLQREGSTNASHGLGFDAEREDVSLSKLYAQWQKEKDPHVFRVILSAEHGNRLDQREFTRAFMERVEKDLGIKTQWAAIDHYNTEHPHVHLSIRGKDVNGHELRIDSEYLWGGMRQRGREVATELLGWRLAKEVENAKEKAMVSEWWNQLDNSIESKAEERRIREETPLTKYERGRLDTLTARGYAWKDDGQGWELSRRWEALKHRKPEGRGPAREHQHEHIQDERGRDIEW